MGWHGYQQELFVSAALFLYLSIVFLYPVSRRRWQPSCILDGAGILVEQFNDVYIGTPFDELPP
jgi:hypothetical protein